MVKKEKRQEGGSMTRSWSWLNMEGRSDPEQRWGSHALSPCAPKARKAMAKRHSTNMCSCWGWQGPRPLGEMGHWQSETSRECSKQKPPLNTLNHTIRRPLLSPPATEELQKSQNVWNVNTPFVLTPRRPMLCALSVRRISQVQPRALCLQSQSERTPQMYPPFWPPVWPWFKCLRKKVSLRNVLTLSAPWQMRNTNSICGIVCTSWSSSPNWTMEVGRLMKSSAPPANATISFSK